MLNSKFTKNMLKKTVLSILQKQLKRNLIVLLKVKK